MHDYEQVTRLIRALHLLLLRLAIALLLAATLASCSLEARKARYLQSADLYFNAREYEKAKIEYLNVLRLSLKAKDPRAIQQLGLIWLAEGEPLRAYPYLLQTRDLAPENLEMRTKLAVALASLGESAAARKEALAVLERSPGNEEALLVLADTVRSDEDIREVEQQIRKTPDNDNLSYHLAWATLANRVGQAAYVKSELQEALKADPKSVRAHLMAAVFYSEQAEADEADKEFETAVELSSSEPEASVKFAEFLRHRGVLDKARAVLEDTVKAAPDYQPARCLLAEVAFEQGKTQEALSLLERVLDIDFAYIDALVLQSRIWLAQGKTKEAVECVQRLDLAYPNVALIKYQLARAYLQNNDSSQAIIALDQAISAKPDYVDAILLLGQLQLQAGNAVPVIPAMMGLLKQQPRLRSAQLLLAEAYRVVGRFDDAALILRDQIVESPKSPDGYIRLGIVLAQENKIDEARRLFETAIALSPNDLIPFERLVDLEISAHAFDAALQAVQRQLIRMPESAVVHFARGKICAAKADWNCAEESLRKAIAIDPNLPAAYELLASGYLANGRVEQAIQELQSELTKNPGDERAMMTLALIYDKEKDFAKARDGYEKVLSINPRFTSALNNLACLYADEFNNPGKAYDLARKARTLEPINPTIADTLGWALFKQHDYPQALNFIEESARAEDDPKVQFHLGMAQYMMDQPDKARAAFKKAVMSTIASPTKQEAARWLAYLEDDSGAPKQLSIGELETLVQQRPNDVVARMRLAAIHEKEGAFEKAAAEYEAAINANSKLAEPLIKLAQLYAGPMHDPRKALELAKTARELDGGNPQTARVLGKVAYQTGNSSWAYNLLQDSTRQLPQDFRALYDFAWAAYSLGKIDEARDLMQRVLKIPGSSEVSQDCESFLAMTDVDPKYISAATERQVQGLLKLDPNYVPALQVQAVIQIHRGQKQAAIETYSDILRRFPDFAPAQKALAALYLEEHTQLTDARDLVMKAHTAAPDDFEATVVLAELSYEVKEYSYAIQLLEEGARANSLDARALYYLGMAHFRMEQQTEGKDALKRSLAAGLQEPFASEAKRMLASLSERKG